MSRSASFLLALTLLLPTAALAQQHYMPARGYGYSQPRGFGYRPGGWGAVGPGLMMAPMLGLLPLLMRPPPPAVIVAPVGVPVGTPAGGHPGLRHDGQRPHRTVSHDEP